MDRKRYDFDFETPRYAYGKVEAALATVFGAKRPAERARVKAHIKHLMRLGLGGGVGKGARVQYTLAQASQWLLAMLMSEIGIDQVISVHTIKKAWPQLLQRSFERVLRNAQTGKPPVWLTLRPKPMTGWAKGGSIEWIGFYDWEDDRSPPPNNYTLLTKAVEDQDSWLGTRNLSRVMLKFVTELESEGN
jgi:hypothetical protein